MDSIECIIEVIFLQVLIYSFFVLRNWNKAAKKIQELAEKYLEDI